MLLALYNQHEQWNSPKQLLVIYLNCLLLSPWIFALTWADERLKELKEVLYIAGVL